MNTKTKTVVILVVAVAAIGLLTGAAFFVLNKDPAAASGGDASTASSLGAAITNEPALPAGYYPDGETLMENPGVVLTVDGVDIDFGLYRAYFNYYRDYFYYYYGETCFDGEDGEQLTSELKMTTEDNIRYAHYYLSMAAKTGIELTEEEKQAAVTVAEEDFNSQDMGTRFTTYALYEQMAWDSALCQKMAEAYYEQLVEEKKAELSAEMGDAQGAYATVEHILLMLDSGQEKTEDSLATLQEQAEELCRQIGESKDAYAEFTALREEFDMDSGQPAEGYTFGPGSMMQAFYDAAIALEVDEISQPVFVDDYYTGYHIIYRKALNEDDLADSIANSAQNLAYEALYAAEEEAMESYTVSYGSYYDNIDVNTVK